MNWALQPTKGRFSEVVKRARSEGPQTVTLRGGSRRGRASAEDYDRLAGRGWSRSSDALLAGPDMGRGFRMLPCSSARDAGAAAGRRRLC